jgi:hypothetical protein
MIKYVNIFRCLKRLRVKLLVVFAHLVECWLLPFPFPSLYLTSVEFIIKINVLTSGKLKG